MATGLIRTRQEGFVPARHAHFEHLRPTALPIRSYLRRRKPISCVFIWAVTVKQRWRQMRALIGPRGEERGRSEGSVSPGDRKIRGTICRRDGSAGEKMPRSSASALSAEIRKQAVQRE
ncbi:hypothetical protein IRJ41_014340 [Triplophysa rosa]|uniref:Uncharacterized protein n=1 Tax=Triplophysa rosa TaxID=992332 RepID=A0A9W7X3R9_TRIRA|nr:hypothetical protein IRJ41_014340 [Triplophysa rosa]